MVIPTLFYLVTRYYTDRTIYFPPYFAAQRVDSVSMGGVMHYDTIFHRVGNFHLINQLGDSVSFHEIGPRIVLVDFFFTACTTICPVLTANLKKVQTAFGAADTGLMILSFSVDPADDSVSRLKAYADHFGADPDSWWFLTGDKKQIYDMATHQFYVDAQQGNGAPQDFVHTDKWILLDRHRYIRGYYNGVDSSEVSRCMNDIGRLMMEKNKPR
ncbi:MAG TPA: SCO family protein [Chitinophagaceae bacterium]|nr:SCO family protein [Chitinophagaceae bacterium]